MDINLPVNHYMGFSKNQHFVQQNSNMTQLSFTGQLKNIEPQKVWNLFEQINQIYRPSIEIDNPSTFENQKEISEWMKNRLIKAGFTIQSTEEGIGKYNVVATRNVSKSKKNAIILQAHLDMVYVPNNIDHKIPRKLIIDGDWIKADNRTLGADNGIGLAIAVAIAEDSNFKDLPIEIIATTDEEIGCYGASAIKPENLMGKFLINLDSEEFGIITQGCAALDRFEETTNIKMEPVNSENYKMLRININNATGGHSGMDIAKGRVNPIRELLSILKSTSDIRLISLKGGDKFNSIPTNIEACLLIPSSTSEFNVSKIDNTLSRIKNKHIGTDPKMGYSIELSKDTVSSKTMVIQKDFQDKLVSIVGSELWSGLKSCYDNGDSKTSQNISIIDLENGKFSLAVSMRSSDKFEKDELLKETTKYLSQLFARSVSTYNNEKSIIWEPKLDSKLTKLALSALKEANVENPVVAVVHGGLENAEFSQIKPELDQISIGPDIVNPHSAQEAIRISSVKKFYNFLKTLLTKLSQTVVNGEE